MSIRKENEARAYRELMGAEKAERQARLARELYACCGLRRWLDPRPNQPQAPGPHAGGCREGKKA